LLFCSTAFINIVQAQLGEKKEVFTHADTLRGTLNPNRTWWDVLKYDIEVKPNYNAKTIQGKVSIIYKTMVLNKKDKEGTKTFIKNAIGSDSMKMQIDLQQPLIIDSITVEEPIIVGVHSSARIEGTKSKQLTFKREDNIAIVIIPGFHTAQYPSGTDSITIYYHGTPREAIRPPWDGGWIWKKDSLGRPWMSVACQGLGASVWYPCKDHQSDEPDNGASLTMIVPDTLVAVGNGRLKSKTQKDGLATYTWEVVDPINNYNIIPYIGKYVNWTDTLMGAKGKLDLSYWVLDYELQKAKTQFQQAKPMLRAFEYWFGPYPFYEDGYKLVQSPHLGMEHQSAVAYGNGFQNGYRGTDLSGSGWGLKWDFIIVHESGHEWFANNITSKDLADMWLHEGFTNYSETLFTEYYYGKDAGNEYNYGTRKRIQNDRPIIGHYGVNKEGSSDMYYKGGNLLQTIRHSINNDEKWRQILTGLNKTYYHQTVTTKQVEDYISKQSGIDFSKVFDQYLRTTQIPQLAYFYSKDKKELWYIWDNCKPGFDLQLVLKKDELSMRLSPTTEWKKITLTSTNQALFDTTFIEKNYYIQVKKTEK
jgi:aminopeptidase N